MKKSKHFLIALAIIFFWVPCTVNDSFGLCDTKDDIYIPKGWDPDRYFPIPGGGFIYKGTTGTQWIVW